ncbi:MAG: carbon-nitrogen hydrolase family protein, partial [Armatimonadaceae bacterium]
MANNSPDEPVRVALVQMTVVGGDIDGNLARAHERIAAAAALGARIAVLPECLDSGWTFPTARDLATDVPGGALCALLAESAREHGMVVCAGLTERDSDRVYNTAVLLGPDGRLLSRHRKINELAIAHGVYDQGDRLSVVPTPMGTLGTLVCADAVARGGALLNSLALMGADIILSPCAWAVAPDHDNTVDPYGTLWRDAYTGIAKEQGCAVVGVSNVGWVVGGAWDGWRCIGCSLAVDTDGRELLQAPYGADADGIHL